MRGPFDMALGAEMARRAFPALGGADEEVSARAAAFLAAETGRPVDPVVWGDEKRMKREAGSSWRGPRPWRPWRPPARTPLAAAAVHDTPALACI